MKKVVTTLILFIFFTGCFRVPPLRKYKLYDRNAMYSNVIDTNDIYYYQVNDSIAYILKFVDNNSVDFSAHFIYNDKSFSSVNADINKNIANKSRNKSPLGHYKVTDESIDIEIVNGDPIAGYVFEYYTGNILPGGDIVLKESSIRKYHVQFSDRKANFWNEIFLMPQNFKLKKIN